MESNSLFKLSSFSLIIGGLSIALFWILIIPFDTFAGATTATDPIQLTGQVFHTLGAIMLIFGFFGLYAYHHNDIKYIGFIGFVLTILGEIGFLVDAIIGLIIAPALAVDAPAVAHAPTG